MQKRFVLNGFVMLGIAAAMPAFAQDAGFYAGAGIGQATVKTDDDAGRNFDADDVAFKVFGGYSFNTNFAAELAYFDGGAPDQNFGLGNVAVEPSGVNLSLLGRMPLNDSFSIFGKVGYASIDLDATGRVAGSVVATGNESQEDFSYGIGAAYHVGQMFQFRAEYEAVNVEGGDFDMFTISGLFEF